MKLPFIWFVVVSLLIDLAMPSLPGAFRFDPDESAVGVRVQPVQAQNLKPAQAVDSLRESFEQAQVAMKTPIGPQRRMNTPDLTVFLPRREPSRDRSPQHPAEDD